jgi:hypothetical protein
MALALAITFAVFADVAPNGAFSRTTIRLPDDFKRERSSPFMVFLGAASALPSTQRIDYGRRIDKARAFKGFMTGADLPRRRAAVGAVMVNG